LQAEYGGVTDAANPEPPTQHELAREVALFVLAVLLAHACAIIPIVVSLLINPWLGPVVAVGAFWVWDRFGPPPMPGFLSGIVCLWGYGAVLGSLAVCLTLVVRSLLN
jgi:hypothetical protein